MTETKYRLKSLQNHKGSFDGKRIALYGSGDNAKAILQDFPEQNIVALLDQQHTGKYIFGKKVISLEEAVLLGIEVIIIAAEAASSKIVSERIFLFCQEHSILLLNMYGINEKDMKRQILWQEIEYMKLCERDLRNQILKHDVVCIQLLDVLCASRYFEQEDFLNALEKKCRVERLAERRTQAEKMVNRSRVYGIKDIYNNYRLMMSLTEEKTRQLQQEEENLFIDGIIPRTKMVHLLNHAILKEKKVVIVSDLYYSEETVQKILKKIGLKKCDGIIQENLMHMTLSNGALRRGMEDYFEKSVIFIGTKHNFSLMLSQLYCKDICMVKNAWEMLIQVSDLHIKKEDIPLEKRNFFSEWVQSTMNSPFVEDVQGYVEKEFSLFEEVGQSFRYHETKAEELDIMPMPQYGGLQELEVLAFPIYKEPVVSVIIPVYNQFAYTYNCLKSILYHTGDIKYEVIIADDGSADDTVYLEQVVQGVRIFRNQENMLFLLNCNRAARYAKGKYIIFLNNDTQVQNNWMKPLVWLLDRDPDAGMAGSKLICPDGTLQEAGGIIWKDGTGSNYGRGENPNAPEYNYVKEVDYISGASIIIRKELWEKIGGFDERYVPAYCEDSDIAFEIRRIGKKVLYQPASVVVHFEGTSNGQDLSCGIKSYQTENSKKLAKKWAEVFAKEQYENKSENVFRARERKQGRNTVVVFSETIPKYDHDAGSKTIYSYLQLFLEHGYIVKFVPRDFEVVIPYTHELQQMGIEVLYGEYYKKYINMWLLKNETSIEFAFINYPACGERFLDILKCTSIKTIYYGVDLHFLRNQREYELTGDLHSLHTSEKYYKVEKDILEKADEVYYPSEVEVEVIKEKFRRNAKYLSAFIYESDMDKFAYVPEEREGILFVGGFNHLPNVDAVLWFAKEIYPQICRTEKISFYIVGSNEPIEIQNVKAPDIIHKGYVTEAELQSLYQNVRLVVVPLRYGAGIKGKVVDAMYHGVPMVATSIGIEGIPEAEDYVETADDADTFAKKVISLYKDRSKLLNTSEEYKRIIAKHFSKEIAWENIKNDFI
ncbi:MAG: glycosyltransferase [Dorea sp.]|nr:glycosyltransferase [Dorea sp.]